MGQNQLEDPKLGQNHLFPKFQNIPKEVEED
jgi:hypothetical protein